MNASLEIWSFTSAGDGPSKTPATSPMDALYLFHSTPRATWRPVVLAPSTHMDDDLHDVEDFASTDFEVVRAKRKPATKHSPTIQEPTDAMDFVTTARTMHTSHELRTDVSSAVLDNQDRSERDDITDLEMAHHDPPLGGRKKKFNIESVIPEPHYIEYPEAPGKPRARLNQLKPHIVRRQLQPDALEKLARPFARYTWIIPVTGRPPCTQKLTLGAFVPPDDGSRSVSQTTRAASLVSGTAALMAWTPEDLLIFWLWLRDTREQSIFGKISLSFTSTKVPSSAVDERPEKVYYISVYHDSGYAMQLRAYIAVFNPVTMAGLLSPESKGILIARSLDGTVRPRNVLKGARLLLTDEHGRGLVTA